MTVASDIANLLSIAERAVQVHETETERKVARAKLNSAYRNWKSQNRVGELRRDSDEWDQMMAATKAEFEALEKAKRRERNARKRLADAVVRSGRARAIDLDLDGIDLEAA